jgi:hypothetical protein
MQNNSSRALSVSLANKQREFIKVTIPSKEFVRELPITSRLSIRMTRDNLLAKSLKDLIL